VRESGRVGKMGDGKLSEKNGEEESGGVGAALVGVSKCL